MSAVNDYLSLLPSTLQWVSNYLDSLSVVPWPFWVGGVFPVYVGVVYLFVWLQRGSAWPVRCIYPVTSRGNDCKMLVAGEWYRCRHHNWRAAYKYGHTVDTSIRRWQTVSKSGHVIDRRFEGAGFLGRKAAKETVLYRHGFARQPLDVLRLLPEAIPTVIKSLQLMRLRTPTAELQTDKPGSPRAQGAVAPELSIVIQATRLTAGAAFVGISVTILAILLSGLSKAITQWIATLAFVLAWAAVNAGVYNRRADWFGGTCVKALKWWSFVFVPVAIINLAFSATV